MKKICKVCNEVKDINDFHIHRTMRDGHRNECKDCKNKICRGIKSKKPKEYHNNKSRLYRKANRDKIVEYYGGKLTCIHCGLQDPIFSVYDFHHLDRTLKLEGIGQLINKGWKRIEAELKKCIVLCANCYRKVHYEENQETLKG